ncbi:MAG: hypothetical protein GF353_26645, partial [Candidatus Lokiarchaeota archaeon]|nr:hypothetical protein [Candidatus Lokiarchaeota archaeon]
MNKSYLLTSFISILLLTFFFQHQSWCQPAENSENYTVQVASFPIADSAKALEAYHQLKEQNYFVFLQRAWIKDRGSWLRVQVGYFDDYSAAKRFAQEFQEKEQREYFIAKTQLTVAQHDSGFSVIHTPSAIWYHDASGFREIFDLTRSLVNRRIEGEYSTPSISPDGQYVLFEY